MNTDKFIYALIITLLLTVTLVQAQRDYVFLKGEETTVVNETYNSSKTICAERGHIIEAGKIMIRSGPKVLEIVDYPDSTVVLDYRGAYGSSKYCTRCKQWLFEDAKPSSVTIWKRDKNPFDLELPTNIKLK